MSLSVCICVCVCVCVCIHLPSPRRKTRIRGGEREEALSLSVRLFLTAAISLIRLWRNINLASIVLTSLSLYLAAFRSLTPLPSFSCFMFSLSCSLSSHSTSSFAVHPSVPLWPGESPPPSAAVANRRQNRK